MSRSATLVLSLIFSLISVGSSSAWAKAEGSSQKQPLAKANPQIRKSDDFKIKLYPSKSAAISSRKVSLKNVLEPIRPMKTPVRRAPASEVKIQSQLGEPLITLADSAPPPRPLRTPDSWILSREP